MSQRVEGKIILKLILMVSVAMKWMEINCWR